LNYTSGTIDVSFNIAKGTAIPYNFSIPEKTYGQDISFNIIDPSSNSDGSFRYDTSQNSIVDISGKKVTIKTAGNVTIRAIQDASLNYNSGTIDLSFNIAKWTPTFSNFLITGKTYGQDISFTIIDPSSNSDGSFRYDTSQNSIVDISGRKVTIKTAGNVTIRATQDTSLNYTSGTIDVSFNIAKAIPTLSNFAIASGKIYGDASFSIIDPSSNSDGSFNYTSSNRSVADVSINIVTIKGAGSATIMGTQSATTNYISKTIDVSFNVGKGTPTLSNFTITEKTYGDVPFRIPSPSSNSNGSFNYISSDTSVAEVYINKIM
jgi:hypothetical protein